MNGFNTRGTIMFLLAFGVGFAIAEAAGAPYRLHTTAEGIAMMVAGPFLSVLDVGYRIVKRVPIVRRPSAGGTFLFVPVWIWGLFWFGLGASYYLHYSR